AAPRHSGEPRGAQERDRVKPIVLAVALLVLVASLEARAEPMGSALAGLGAYDEFMVALIKKWDVPGASLAVAYKDRLLLVRGYGFANKARSVPVEPTSLFRLASLSKTLTAVAVLQLVQDGRLKRKLDSAPGAAFAYSNVGYCILGRVVERVTGAPYETHVREHVLAPVGATRMRIGRTLQPAEGEVAYYDYRGATEVRAMPGL